LSLLVAKREVTKEFAAAMSKLARVLAENLGNQKSVFEDICDESTCFLRLNRYPTCPISPEIFGLVPHTDSDFLTILCQDQVGGLQLMKDSQWVAAKPNKDALVVNIGDLFQVNFGFRYTSYFKFSFLFFFFFYFESNQRTQVKVASKACMMPKIADKSFP